MSKENTEIKYRGPLSKNQLEKLKSYLNKNAQIAKSGFERAIFFDTSIYPAIGDFQTGFSRISLKRDDRGIVLRIKDGNPTDSMRKERVIHIKKQEYSNLIYLLDSLGLKHGFYRPAYREEYMLNNMIITIKTKCIMGDHFEIEFKNESHINKANIDGLLNRFSLSFWPKREYLKRIHDKMKEFPAINVYESKEIEK